MNTHNIILKEESINDLKEKEQWYNYRGFTNNLGIFGYGDVEFLLIIGLVTQDPLILIGDMGSGKTHILNNISKLLGLNHKHYNASIISFDDVVGFPYPLNEGDGNKMKIEYIMTPATVWDAESVLIDEINRCKPEVQNKLFSLIYEKKLQGIEIKKLVYRWAAMNPYQKDQDEDVYLGVEPLDKALADRFSLFIEVPKWNLLNDKIKQDILKNMIDPDIRNCERFINFINKKRKDFEDILKNPPLNLVKYVIDVSRLAKNGDIVDISVRRAKIIMKNISALLALDPNPDEQEVYKVLKSSIPDICWREDIEWDKLNLIHKSVFRLNKIELFKDRDIENFFATNSYIEKAKLLINIEPIEKRSMILKSVIIKAREGEFDFFVFLYLIYPLIMKEIIKLNADVYENFFEYIKGVFSSVNINKNQKLNCEPEVLEIIAENKFLKDFFVCFLNLNENYAKEALKILKDMKEFVDYFKKEGL